LVMVEKKEGGGESNIVSKLSANTQIVEDVHYTQKRHDVTYRSHNNNDA